MQQKIQTNKCTLTAIESLCCIGHGNAARHTRCMPSYWNRVW